MVRGKFHVKFTVEEVCRAHRMTESERVPPSHGRTVSSECH